MSVWTNTTLPESPLIGGAAVLGFGPRIWSMLATLIFALIACRTVGISWGPKIGCRMIPLYCFDAITVCSCASCFFGSLAASKTVTDAFWALATFFAAASIGASYVFATANDRYATFAFVADGLAAAPIAPTAATATARTATSTAVLRRSQAGGVMLFTEVPSLSSSDASRALSGCVRTWPEHGSRECMSAKR